MKQKNKFWFGLLLITVVCFFDYQLFTEGYSVRKISPMIRQAGHLVILLAVMPVGYWVWKSHPMKWLKKLWLISYSAIIIFIVLIGALKSSTGLNKEFLDWVTTVRYLFCSPMPHVFIFMISQIALTKTDNAQ